MRFSAASFISALFMLAATVAAETAVSELSILGVCLLWYTRPIRRAGYLYWEWDLMSFSFQATVYEKAEYSGVSQEIPAGSCQKLKPEL